MCLVKDNLVIGITLRQVACIVSLMADLTMHTIFDPLIFQVLEQTNNVSSTIHRVHVLLFLYPNRTSSQK